MKFKNVDFVKIDVELRELEVLKSMSDVLKIYRPNIICEILPGEQRHDIISLMQTHDYDLYRIHLRRMEPIYDMSRFSKKPPYNVLLTTMSRADVQNMNDQCLL